MPYLIPVPAPFPPSAPIPVPEPVHIPAFSYARLLLPDPVIEGILYIDIDIDIDIVTLPI